VEGVPSFAAVPDKDVSPPIVAPGQKMMGEFFQRKQPAAAFGLNGIVYVV
jgi:hypothetical protein